MSNERPRFRFGFNPKAIRMGDSVEPEPGDGFMLTVGKGIISALDALEDDLPDEMRPIRVMVCMTDGSGAAILTYGYSVDNGDVIHDLLLHAKAVGEGIGVGIGILPGPVGKPGSN
jgi:hypothetical protein